MKRTLLRGGYILTMSERKQPRIGSLAILGNRIEMISYDDVEVNQYVLKYPNCEVIDCSGHLIMPGLINTHAHVSMTLMRNMAEDHELMDWLTNYIWPFEAKQSPEDIAAGTRLGVAEMLLGGTTTFVDMYWSESAIAEVVEAMGIRALLTECVLDGREEQFVAGMQRLEEVAIRTPRVMAGVGPHAPYTCSQATLGLAAKYAEERGQFLTIHLNETRFERDTIAQNYGKTPLQYIVDGGVVTPDTILAHCVDLTDEDIELIARSRASVAHNAQSNMKLASGVAPIAKLHAAGVNCTIATDGASSNNDLDMWEEIRTAALLQRVRPAVVADGDTPSICSYDILKMAIVNGAKAIGLEGELGMLREGMIADIIVVNISAPHHRPRLDMIASLVYCAKSADVRDVIVDGEVVVRDRELLGVDLEAICRDAEKCTAALLEA